MQGQPGQENPTLPCLRSLSQSPPAALTGANWFSFARWRLTQSLGPLQPAQRPSLRLGGSATLFALPRNCWRWSSAHRSAVLALAAEPHKFPPASRGRPTEGGRDGGREGGRALHSEVQPKRCCTDGSALKKEVHSPIACPMPRAKSPRWPGKPSKGPGCCTLARD